MQCNVLIDRSVYFPCVYPMSSNVSLPAILIFFLKRIVVVFYVVVLCL
jgi:hypothetical protein